jgi:hypothetical protein
MRIPEADAVGRVNVVRPNASPQLVSLCPHIGSVFLVAKYVFNYQDAGPIHVKVQTVEDLQLPSFYIHRQEVDMADVLGMCF